MAKKYSGSNPKISNPFSRRSGGKKGSGSGSGNGRGAPTLGNSSGIEDISSPKYPPAPPPFDFEGYEANKSAQFREEQQAKIRRRQIEEQKITQAPRGYAYTVDGKIVGEKAFLSVGSEDRNPELSLGINPPPINVQGVPPENTTKNGPKPIPEPEVPNPINLEESEVGLIKQSRPEDPSEVAERSPLILSNLTKEVFDKDSFNNTLDITFTQLGLENQLDPNFFDVNLATQEDFWTLYEKFFYDIPKKGDVNSHEYLAKTSGEYANFEFIQEQIQALLDEIAEIREENVELRIENVNLTVTGSLAQALQNQTRL